MDGNLDIEGGTETASPADLSPLVERARDAATLLKTLGHEGRLTILCHLATGEKSVTELERLLSARQAAVSQQLARLRLEGLVQHRRDGKTIYYSLKSETARKLLDGLCQLLGSSDDKADRGGKE
ncbi:MAG: transcriptional regulator [Alphaproteobacteria bacterium]|nr:MAG: transcriptional regulator [Alphaproteobacteria bacterium]